MTISGGEDKKDLMLEEGIRIHIPKCISVKPNSKGKTMSTSRTYARSVCLWIQFEIGEQSWARRYGSHGGPKHDICARTM